MLWTALLLDASPGTPGRIDAAREAARGLATWCLQFTPRVAIVEAADVVMETEASVRLLGGWRRLAERVREEARELGVGRLGRAPTSLAALALARCGTTTNASACVWSTWTISRGRAAMGG
jgi:protein ImuB